MKYSIVVLLVMHILFVGCQPKERVITGYETKVVFISDDDAVFIDINTETKQGWEIKSTRRAVKRGYSFKADEWGTEYTLQKPIYEE